ncbi:hypothetical protein [Paenibacillus antarcticus]|uniref:Uncharacterized protein n=1 Tax=Paenibacillus antarcticus TaxID=253703 RepID=A0A168N9I8_9BACL|nr:hypothetical protein [Paenibacillus antarcticus]OAB45547.1 hypothetical protein PBAT_11515 [Paenibacillus antarcticus]
MNIFFAPADEFKGQLIGIVVAVLLFGLIPAYSMRKREGYWEPIGLVVDFMKVIFYGLLTFLTLYLQYDEATKSFSLSLIDRKLSLGEILVILLAAFEVIANIISIRIGFGNISKSNTNHIIKILEDIEKDREEENCQKVLQIEMEMEMEIKRKLEEKQYKEKLIAIRNERLNKIKDKKYKYI